MLLAAALLSLLPALSAQTVFMPMAVEDAKDLASAQGRLILVDFFANWCTPCVQMDLEVWSDPEVQAAQAAFVNIRVDASYSSTELRRWGFAGIPALLILDPSGRVYYRQAGFQKKGEVTKLLQTYAADMTEVYFYDRAIAAEDETFASYYKLGLALQGLARLAEPPFARTLVSGSDDAFGEAGELLGESAPAGLRTWLALLHSENLLLKGNARKAIKSVQAVGDELEPKADAFACYLLALAYHELGKDREAGECYARLEQLADGEQFLERYAEARRPARVASQR